VQVLIFLALVPLALCQSMPPWPKDYQTTFATTATHGLSHSGYLYFSGSTNETRTDIKQADFFTSVITKQTSEGTDEWLIMRLRGGITTCTHRTHPPLPPNEYVCSPPVYRGQSVIDGVNARQWDISCTAQYHSLPNYIESLYFSPNNVPVRVVVKLQVGGNVTTDFSNFEAGRLDPSIFALPPQCGRNLIAESILRENHYYNPTIFPLLSPLGRRNYSP
jgi:hypothetical protein